MKVADLRALPPKILIYGPAGTGKTALLLTLGSKLQLVDTDGNIGVAFGLQDDFTEARQSVDVHQFLDEDFLHPTAFTRAKKYIYGLGAEIKKGSFGFDYLGLDSLTALSAGCQSVVMRNSGKVGENPQIQHWGLILTEIGNVVKALRSLPIPVFMIAHQTTFVSEDVSQIQIDIPGQKLPGQITRMFDEIWYMRLKPIGQGKSEIYIQTAPTSTITCRSSRGLPSGTHVGTIGKQGEALDSVGLQTIINKIIPNIKEPAA